MNIKIPYLILLLFLTGCVTTDGYVFMPPPPPQQPKVIYIIKEEPQKNGWQVQNELLREYRDAIHRLSESNERQRVDVYIHKR